MPRTLADLAGDQTTISSLAHLNSFESPAEAAALLELARGKKVLEVGTFLGYSAILMSKVAELVHTVDWHRGGHELGEQDTLATAWTNIRKAGATNIVMMVGRSEDVLPWLAGPYDMAFIDGSHEYRDVAHDIEWTLPICDTLVFHDYYGYLGVAKAVDELVWASGLELQKVAGSLMMVRQERDIIPD